MMISIHSCWRQGRNPSLSHSCTRLIICSVYSIGDIEITKYLLGCSVDANTQGLTSATPQLTALHIAVRGGCLDIVKLLCEYTSIDINRQDQYGFTPLIYAVIARNKEIILYLTSRGASSILASKAGSTPLDIAKELNYDDIVDILLSKTNSETDPTLPQFRNWLCSLGAGEYLPKFVEAGYDLKFIVKQGLTDQDLDCIGIPMSKLGIRRKITTLHKLSEFYTAEDEDEGEEGEEEEEEEEEGEEGEEED